MCDRFVQHPKANNDQVDADDVPECASRNPFAAEYANRCADQRRRAHDRDSTRSSRVSECWPHLRSTPNATVHSPTTRLTPPASFNGNLRSATSGTGIRNSPPPTPMNRAAVPVKTPDTGGDDSLACCRFLHRLGRSPSRSMIVHGAALTVLAPGLGKAAAYLRVADTDSPPCHGGRCRNAGGMAFPAHYPSCQHSQSHPPR
jgi:hypothetical protein